MVYIELKRYNNSLIKDLCRRKTLPFISLLIGNIQITFWFAVTPEKIFYKEYLVYDAIGAFGSIGGSLGLFVGFSIFDTVCTFINFVLKKFKCA